MTQSEPQWLSLIMSYIVIFDRALRLEVTVVLYSSSSRLRFKFNSFVAEVGAIFVTRCKFVNLNLLCDVMPLKCILNANVFEMHKNSTLEKCIRTQDI